MTAEPLLPAALLARLERLQLATRRRLSGALTGEHRSPRHGSSLDFADFREYHPGDDLRRLDIHALAKHDRLMLTLFEAEDDLSLRLFIDTSGSMAGPKLRRAAELAGALGFAALVRRDVVTVHTFPNQTVAPRFRGRAATQPLFDVLASLRAEGETPFIDAAVRLLARPGPAGLTILLSDMLTPEWEAGLRRLPARRGDLVVIHVLDPTDLDPALTGDLELVDAESGARVEVSLSSSVAADYRALAERWAGDVAARVRGVGGAYLRVSTADTIESIVLGSARSSGVLR